VAELIQNASHSLNRSFEFSDSASANSYVQNCEMGLHEMQKLLCFDPEISDFEDHPGLQSLPWRLQDVFTFRGFSVD
jgi:hypothetical protein